MALEAMSTAKVHPGMRLIRVLCFGAAATPCLMNRGHPYMRALPLPPPLTSQPNTGVPHLRDQEKSSIWLVTLVPRLLCKSCRSWYGPAHPEQCAPNRFPQTLQRPSLHSRQPWRASLPKPPPTPV